VSRVKRSAEFFSAITPLFHVRYVQVIEDVHLG